MTERRVHFPNNTNKKASAQQMLNIKNEQIVSVLGKRASQGALDIRLMISEDFGKRNKQKYLTFEEWVIEVNRVFVARFGTVKQFLNTKYAKENLSFVIKSLNDTPGDTSVGNISDYLVDSSYADMYDESFDPYSAGIIASKKSYHVWRELVENYVFKKSGVFVDDLFRLCDHCDFLELYFNSGYNWKHAGDAIISEYYTNDEYCCKVFFNWMRAVDIEVYSRTSKHLNNLGYAKRFFCVDYVESYCDESDYHVLSDHLVATYIWMEKINEIVREKCGKELGNIQYFGFTCDYHAGKRPIEVANVIMSMERTTRLALNFTKNDSEFIEWMKHVDYIVYDSIEYHLSDLPDEDFMLNYEHGITTNKMAEIVISNFKTSFGFLDC